MNLKVGDKVTFDSIGVPHKATVADGKACLGDGWVLVTLDSCGDLCQIPIDQIQGWTAAEDDSPITCGVPDGIPDARDLPTMTDEEIIKAINAVTHPEETE